MNGSILDLSVAAARDDDVFNKLLQMTGLTPRRLANRLQLFDGRTRLRTALEGALPLDEDALGAVTVAQARSWGLSSEIERVFGISSERIDAAFDAVHGRMSVRRALGLGEQETEDDVELEEQDGEESSEEEDDKFSNLGPEWSRPRLMSRVLRAVGFGVPSRLRSERFQAMLVELRNQGIEICFADDAQQRVLDVDEPSPGIATKVRLRRAAGDDELAPAPTRPGEGDEGEGWSRLRPMRALFAQLGLSVPDELAQEDFSALIEALEVRGYEVATAEGVRLTPLHDAVSVDAEVRLRHDALAAPPPSLRSLLGHSGADQAPAPVQMRNDYERASLKLELLTAGVEPQIVTDAWVTRCVEIATAGLAIHGVKQEVLVRVASALAQIPRHPVAVLTSLVRRLDPEDGEVLLREYAMLHPEQPELCELLSQHWSAVCATAL